MTDPRAVPVDAAVRRRHGALPWLAAVGVFMTVISPVVLFAGAQPCQVAMTGPFPTRAGPWIATVYGPPWDAMNGSGVTATGLNLTAGPPAYEIAVDPAVIPLQTFEHVTPNPFGTRRAFYAGDTGGAIIGQHVDIYDWQGRAAQDAWGVRHVTVTPAPNPAPATCSARSPRPPLASPRAQPPRPPGARPPLTDRCH
jgi:3D (Asp-Asp-Asp) domain-containing protein